MAKRQPDLKTVYHAHVYFDAKTKRDATLLRNQAKRLFKITDKSRNFKLGRVHDKPVGPHPRPMYLIWFVGKEFNRVVPWLAVNRRGLSVLVHPQLNDDPVVDHTDNAMWLGKPIKLRLNKFSGRPVNLRGF